MKTLQNIQTEVAKGTWGEFKHLVEEAGVLDNHRILWIDGMFGVNGVECTQKCPGEWTITDRY